ncbi:MAG: hypothetical protein WCG01_00380 [bacterium]
MIDKEMNAIKEFKVFVGREIKTHKKIIASFKIVVLIFTSMFPAGFVSASSFQYATDSISNSAPAVDSLHKITIKNGSALSNGDTIDINVPSKMSILTIVCPGASVLSLISSSSASCLFGSSVATGTILSFKVLAINPDSVGGYSIVINSSKNENSSVMFAVVDAVSVSATVDSALEFAVSGVATDTVVNNIATTNTSGSSTLEFGNLTIGTSSVLAHKLSVITNASYGFVVTVEQNQNLTSNTGADISSFKDGGPTYEPWVMPTANLSATSTYGHFGLTSNDASLNGGLNPFGGGIYTGFAAALPIEVMYNSGPADGLTQDKGVASVAYRIEISPFQEAGDYYNNLTYIATPTF